MLLVWLHTLNEKSASSTVTKCSLAELPKFEREVDTVRFPVCADTAFWHLRGAMWLRLHESKVSSAGKLITVENGEGVFCRTFQ